jgi:hypothetical protein
VLLLCHVLAATARGDARRLPLSASRLDWRAISNCIKIEQEGSCSYAFVLTPLRQPGACRCRPLVPWHPPAQLIAHLALEVA